MLARVLWGGVLGGGLLLACGGDGEGATGSGSAATGMTSGTSSTGTASATGAGGGVADGWRALAPLAGGPLQETAVVALAGEVVVVGGYDAEARVVARVEAYAPGTDTWRSLPSLPVERHHLNAAVVDDRLYVLGGLAENAFIAVGETLVYDPVAQTWSTLTSMPAGTERGGAVTAVIGAKIYVAGGYRQGSVADFSVYDTTTDTWETLPALSAARDHLVGGALDGRVFVVGGRSGGIEGVMGEVDLFDPATGTWSVGAPMPTPRAGCAAAALGTRLFVMGGEGNTNAPSGVFAAVEAYDAATDGWEAFPDMPNPRHGTGAAALDGVLYMPGGADRQAFAAVDDNASYQPPH